jgi:DNA modification methylase
MSNKLDKETLDKVREMDGFPIGEDEDIIKLSNPPYHTACPNPFLKDFIKENGTLYDPKNDDYNQTALSSDTSENKHDLIYNVHSYHTKVPPKAIVRHILHYTKPGDVIYDGFGGTGMTGVAAQICNNPPSDLQKSIEKEMPKIKWGERKIILCDISPIATLIAHNMNNPIKSDKFEYKANTILENIEKEYGWMFETQHSLDSQIQFDAETDGNKKPIMGIINYVVWSNVYVCPNCTEELVFWDIAYNNKIPVSKMSCHNCNTQIVKKDLDYYWINKLDLVSNKKIKFVKQIPVLINYTSTVNKIKKRFEKIPDQYDIDLIKKIQKMQPLSFYSPVRMPEGGESRRNDKFGITHVHHFYTYRNWNLILHTLSKLDTPRLKIWLTSTIPKLTILNRYRPELKSRALVGPLPLSLYLPPLAVEKNIFLQLKFQLKKNLNLKKVIDNKNLITTQSSTDIPQIPNNSIDYIFTDPPFGDNIMYSELNAIWESWLKVSTNNKKEAIVNKIQNKPIVEYQKLMNKVFTENYRILKPGRWMTVIFHNSQNKVWVAIQQSLQQSGFVVSDIRTMDKEKSTVIQMSNPSGAVDKDLAIATYKPSGGLDFFFGGLTAGSEESAWKFLNSHLKQLPIFVEKNNIGEIITERQKFLLFDRMIAFHIQKGLTVPISAAEFYEKLNQKYVERDDMYFLSEQVPQYDQKRAQVKSVEQSTIFVEDEKSAILWLNEQLKTPQTYQGIQPKFRKQMYETQFEKLPALLDILKQNFIESDDGKWHIPDPTKAKDLEKMREKPLLKEFQTYVESKSKLKQFRLEAIRAGFKKKWSENDYKSIVDVAKRLPEQIIQEDGSLLMYYDNALSRL